MADYDLIILDFYDTIVHMEDEVWVPRNGIEELLEALSAESKTLAVCSDAGEEKIAERLGELNIYFAAIYGYSNLVFDGSGIFYKNLERICQDFNVPNKNTIFLGDNHKDTDRRSAERYGI